MNYGQKGRKLLNEERLPQEFIDTAISTSIIRIHREYGREIAEVVGFEFIQVLEYGEYDLEENAIYLDEGWQDAIGTMASSFVQHQNNKELMAWLTENSKHVHFVNEGLRVFRNGDDFYDILRQGRIEQYESALVDLMSELRKRKFVILD